MCFYIPTPNLLLQGKDEIALDFAVDDTTGGEHEDALVGMSFHVPRETSGCPAMDEDTPSVTVSTSHTKRLCCVWRPSAEVTTHPLISACTSAANSLHKIPNGSPKILHQKRTVATTKKVNALECQWDIMYCRCIVIHFSLSIRR